MEKRLYLIPVSISRETSAHPNPFLPASLLGELRVVFAEDVRSARRFFRSTGYTGDLDTQEWVALDHESTLNMLMETMERISKGASPAGVLSEAGIPGVADPGSEVVALAHQFQVRVIPLPGPSSIFLALSASGMNGQQFTFHGYLPIHDRERERRLKQLESISLQSNYTQIFMETPYRNMQLLKSILKVCSDDMRLCIAADITGDKEYIRTHTIQDWRRLQPNLHKIPAVFLLNQ